MAVLFNVNIFAVGLSNKTVAGVVEELEQQQGNGLVLEAIEAIGGTGAEVVTEFITLIEGVGTVLSFTFATVRTLVTPA